MIQALSPNAACSSHSFIYSPDSKLLAKSWALLIIVSIKDRYEDFLIIGLGFTIWLLCSPGRNCVLDYFVVWQLGLYFLPKLGKQFLNL